MDLPPPARTQIPSCLASELSFRLPCSSLTWQAQKEFERATISRGPSLVPGRVPSFLQLVGPVQNHMQRCLPFLVYGLHQQKAPAICLIIASCVHVASGEQQVRGV